MTTEKQIQCDGVVFYSDGSAKPNPGVATYGVHGYSYKYDSSKPPTFKYDFTNLGYKKKANDQETKEGSISDNDDDEFENIIDPANYSVKTPGKVLGINAQENNVLTKSAAAVVPVNVYDIYGFVSHNSNNNVAELEAAKAAIGKAVDEGHKQIDIITDSISAVQCFNNWIYKWAENGWRKSDGTLLKNVEYMQDLYKYLSDVTSQGYNYNLHWIEGHAGHYGNERADQNADHVHSYQETISVQRDSASHFSNKTKKPSQLFLPSLIGTIEDKRSDGKYVYITTNREDKIQLYGTKSTTAAYSFLIKNNPIEQIELVYEGCKKFNADNAKYILVDLNKLYSKAATLDIDDLKEKAFSRSDVKSFIIGTAHCPDIAVQLDAPMMVHSVMKICNDSTNTALDAIDGKNIDTHKLHDVTEQFFTKNAKGKTEVVKNFNHTDKSFSLEFDLFGTKSKEDFVPGQCFASRSVFKDLEGKPCKVYLIVKENPAAQSWNYIFCMVCDDFKLITVPGYATVRIKLTQEQKEKLKQRKQKK